MRDKKPIVSIITPCYNGEKYIEQYMQSILNQSYRKCQLIFVDDGSYDGTRDKVFEYKEQLLKCGIEFVYCYQDNKGQAAALGLGLQYVKGEYIIWPDVDDILTPNSIERKLKFLEENKEYGIVRSDFAVVHENNLEDILEYGAQKYPERTKEDLFEDYIVNKNIWLQPGCFMIRTSSLKKSNPQLYIYPSRAGQNWQILLPILYKYKCGYIDEPLYIYILHKGSHSDRKNESYKDKKKRQESCKELIEKTLQHMEIENPKKYLDMVANHYDKVFLDLAFQYNNRLDAKRAIRALRQRKALDTKCFVKYVLTGTLIGEIFKK